MKKLFLLFIVFLTILSCSKDRIETTKINTVEETYMPPEWFLGSWENDSIGITIVATDVQFCIESDCYGDKEFEENSYPKGDYKVEFEDRTFKFIRVYEDKMIWATKAPKNDIIFEKSIN